MRTELIDEETKETLDAGRGSGTETIRRFACPCGQGEVVEFHDRTPGVTQHEATLNCRFCMSKWIVDTSRGASFWELEPRDSSNSPPTPQWRALPTDNNEVVMTAREAAIASRVVRDAWEAAANGDIADHRQLKVLSTFMIAITGEAEGDIMEPPSSTARVALEELTKLF